MSQPTPEETAIPTLTELFESFEKQQYDLEMGAWHERHQERSKHEEIDDTSRTFIGELVKRRDSIWCQSTSILLRGRVTRQTEHVYCPYLKYLCNHLAAALDRYAKSPDKVEQYLKFYKEEFISEAITEAEVSPSINSYLPDAINYEDSRIASILGTYAGYERCRITVADLGRSSDPVSLLSATHPAAPDAITQFRTQAMLAMLLISHTYGVYIPHRDERGRKPVRILFNQTRLANILMKIARQNENEPYVQAIKDIVAGWGELSNRMLLTKVQAISNYLCDGISEDDFQDFVKAELDALSE